MDIDTFRHLGPFSELLSAIVGTIFFYKYNNTPLKYLLYLLWYITITEFSGWYINSNRIEPLLFFDQNGTAYTLWMYNLLRIFTFSTLFYIYIKSINTKKFKRIIKIFLITYIVLAIINWSFIQSFIFEMSEIPKVAGSLFLIISIIFYFIELLRSEKIILFHKTLLFWVSVGLLLYYSGTIPFALKWNGYMLIPGIHKLFLINTVLAIIMYLTFTFGFIWSKKESH